MTKAKPKTEPEEAAPAVATPAVVVVDTVMAPEHVVREDAAAVERQKVADDKADVDAAAASAAKRVAAEKAASDALATEAREKVASDLLETAAANRAEKAQERKYDFYKVVLLATPAIIAAIGAAINVVQVQQVGHSVNGMKKELVEEVRAASFAKGKLEGEKEDPTKSKR